MAGSCTPLIDACEPEDNVDTCDNACMPGACCTREGAATGVITMGPVTAPVLDQLGLSDAT
jgi:hypothetical protein